MHTCTHTYICIYKYTEKTLRFVPPGQFVQTIGAFDGYNVYAYIHTYLSVYIYVRVYTYIRIHTYIHAHQYAEKTLRFIPPGQVVLDIGAFDGYNVCSYIHLDLYIYTYFAYIHTYIYIYKHTEKTLRFIPPGQLVLDIGAFDGYNVCPYIHIDLFIYTYLRVYTHIHIYIQIYRENAQIYSSGAVSARHRGV